MSFETTSKSFPTTRWTVLREARDPDSPAYKDSLQHLAQVYWRPVYAYFRRKWGKADEEAKDLTQDFFLSLCEKNFLPRLSPEKGRLRSYLRTALDNFARMAHRHQTAQKRGGEILHFSLEMAEGFEPASSDSPDQAFVREWAATLFDHALDQMEKDYRDQGKETQFQLFLFKEVEQPEGKDLTYPGLADRFQVREEDLKNILYRARNRFRQAVLDQIRDTVTSEEEAQEEQKNLFEGVASCRIG